MMFFEELERLRQNHLLREIRDRDFTQVSPGKDILRPSVRTILDGIDYINFSSNDYLGLSGNPAIMEAARAAIDLYGFGAGASRLLSGGTELHRQLEKTVALFKETESALLFNSGYAANTSAIPSLAAEGDIIFSDELNHASIIDGCRLSRAKKFTYRHSNPEHLSELAQDKKGLRKIVVTDSVFSMDGDIAPLREIYRVCRHYGMLLYVDDAHATGVLGNGQGALNHFGIRPEPWIIQMGTFSKALGSYGAFIAGQKDVIDWLTNTARGLIYSTALPVCIIAASLKALEMLKEDQEPLKRLWDNRTRLSKGINKLGFNTLESQTPIIPLVVSSAETAVRISNALKNHRLYVPAIRPPTVKTPRLRITISAVHTDGEIDALLDALSQVQLSEKNGL